MIYVRNYGVNPSYKNFLEQKGVNIKSDLFDTDFVDVENFKICLKKMKEKFPGYVKGLEGRNENKWQIYDSSGINLGTSLIPTLEDIKGSIARTLIEADQYDTVLISGYPVLSSEDFDISLFESYRDFGFTEPRDFVMTLGAIMSSEGLVQNENEATWINNGVKTIITADMQGDMRLEQLDMTESINVSHIGSIVPFKPVERKVLHAYFQTESSLLAICLGYIEQIGVTKDMFGEKYTHLKDDLEIGDLKYGPYGNAGDYTHMSLIDGYRKFKNEIARFGGKTMHSILSNPVTNRDGKGYSFYIGPDQNLYIYEGERGNQDYFMKFDLTDAEKIVRGIISNAKNGIGRTGIGGLTALINHINRGGEFDEESMKN